MIICRDLFSVLYEIVILLISFIKSDCFDCDSELKKLKMIEKSGGL